MAGVHLIIGRIASGKTRYAREISGCGRVILSVDELEYDLFSHTLGADYDRMMERVKAYLHKKAVEIASAGTDVVLDWGFWQRSERQAAIEYYRERGIAVTWHYIDVDGDTWKRNIADRNELVSQNATADWYVDEGLLEKLESRFDEPGRDEVDVWVENRRQEN